MLGDEGIDEVKVIVWPVSTFPVAMADTWLALSDVA
jgi:hypothetical protein